MEIKSSTLSSLQQKEQPTQLTKDDLLSLIELGCIKEVVVIEDKKFILKTLGATEQRELEKFYGDSPDEDKKFQGFIKLLANSIVSVNGIPLEEWYQNTELTPIERKEIILSNMQLSTLNKLAAVYNSLATKTNAPINHGTLKNL